MTFPFYEKALALFAKTQKRQIEKGLNKYPTAFNPHDWTPDELLTHALEETVDLTHYLVGLKDLLDTRDVQIKKLRKEVQHLTWELAKLHPPKPIRNKQFDTDDQH
jgi:hypothetical protein